MGPEKVKLTEAESNMVVTRKEEVGEMGRHGSKGTKFQFCRVNKFWRSNVCSESS